MYGAFGNSESVGMGQVLHTTDASRCWGRDSEVGRMIEFFFGTLIREAYMASMDGASLTIGGMSDFSDLFFCCSALQSW